MLPPTTSFVTYTPPPIDCSVYPSPLERNQTNPPTTPPAVWPHETPAGLDMTVCSAVPARFVDRCCEVFGGNISMVCGWPMCLADVQWDMWNACMRLADDADVSSNWGWGAECDALIDEPQTGGAGRGRGKGVGWGAVLGAVVVLALQAVQ